MLIEFKTAGGNTVNINPLQIHSVIAGSLPGLTQINMTGDEDGTYFLVQGTVAQVKQNLADWWGEHFMGRIK